MGVNHEIFENHQINDITAIDLFQSIVQDEFKQLNNVGQSLKTVTRLSDVLPKLIIEQGISAGKLIEPVLKKFPETNETQKPNDKPDKDPKKGLYGESGNPMQEIVADACIQPYGIGNCYFVAAMASMAQVKPEAIRDMIKDNKDGTYTVKFPGASKAITVGQATDEEISQVGGLSKHGVWPIVLMKAYGKYYGGGKLDWDGSDGGSAFSAGVRIFSENGVANLGVGYVLPMMSWKSMDAELNQALNPPNKKDAIPVTASTSKSIFGGDTVDGFVRGHVYSVLAYRHNESDVKQSKVTVRNPHGGSDASKEITLEQFYNNFFQLSMPGR